MPSLAFPASMMRRTWVNGTQASPLGLERVARRCECRERHPYCSGALQVFVEESAESVMSADVEVAQRGWLGDRFG
ncbi:hypothetical protein Acy02nite_47590 [Actinoplanes cyaneus]|uniref:Uncharacterized protein n=1 Tax=Actinoplanes cyaneus TaxID=52696 RepID=A0A919M733_9ACTN|nr:hypothetical protein Acy02nite_47590 [Actinoplanes cyaneus]